MYNKLDDEEEKLFCITGNEKSTAMIKRAGVSWILRLMLFTSVPKELRW